MRHVQPAFHQVALTAAIEAEGREAVRAFMELARQMVQAVA